VGAGAAELAARRGAEEATMELYSERPCRAARPAWSWKRFSTTALGSFAATLALLVAAAPVPGGATAQADGPDGETASPGAVVEGFEPANPAAQGARPAAATIGGVAVSARVEERDGGERLIVVDLANPGRRRAAVACRVGLARVTSRAISPMARVVPPPEREELFSQALTITLEPGALASREVPLPAGIALEGRAPAQRVASANAPAPPRASWLALSVEALDGAD
jgi:hypothetical protein